MREIILDTETTGLDPADGHRIIEIAGLERVDGRLTGRSMHYYLDPGHEVDPGAVEVHGLTRAELEGCPTWAGVERSVLDWLDGAVVVAHRADFDLGHIDAELLRRPGRARKIRGRLAGLVCTRDLAQHKLSHLDSHRLDSLLDYYRIDRSQRETEGHGALLDCQLLAAVYERLVAEGDGTTNGTTAAHDSRHTGA